jgi:hypothetical protein
VKRNDDIRSKGPALTSDVKEGLEHNTEGNVDRKGVSAAGAALNKKKGVKWK